MTALLNWQALLVSVVMVVLAVLLTIWWQQQTFRWPILLLLCLMLAPLASWWSAKAFEVADYRAGCDGLCPGFRGAPIPTYAGESAGGEFILGLYIVNSLVYLVLILGWTGVVRTVLRRIAEIGGVRTGVKVILGTVFLLGPFALAPLYIPPPEAHVRGDPLRISINARREVYLYRSLAPSPVLGIGLEDVRPRRDGQPGMRVCLRSYSYFYIPNGHIYLDMTPEGVHSNTGGIVPLEESCWN